MKIARSWLQNYIKTDLASTELASHLTQRGLEVSNLYPTIKGALSGLVIGEVIACMPHPNADRLQKALVDIGLEEPLSIVCGAPNLQVGLKVVVAPVGTTIYSYPDQQPFQIKKVKIRGAWSQGMLCAADEIGLEPSHDGILTLNTTLAPGTEVKEHFSEAIDDILEIDLTPNRSDACSHLGVARELKAILHLPIIWPKIDIPLSCAAPGPTLTIADPHLCPHYCGLLIKNVTVQPAPAWLRTQLTHIGIKPINNIVDVTNFILHDIGQPIHAFDYDTIQGASIKVQRCTPGSLFTGLDGIERKLVGHELMICDQGGAMAMAGILGGARSRITAETQHIFLESAYFHPSTIRGASQYHHLHTEASFRFERGTDPNMPPYALKKAALLLQAFMPLAEVMEMIRYYPIPYPHFTIPLTYAAITACLGVALPTSLIKEILTDLEIAIEAETETGFTAKVPPYRVDVTRPIDLIEELARIYGYNRLTTPGNLATTYLAPSTPVDHTYKVEKDIAQLLSAQGYCEIWTNSLIRESYVAKWYHQEKTIHLLNPLSSSTSVLRPTLLLSGLEVIAYNIARRGYDLKLFEFGTVYHKKDQAYQEEKRLSIWLTGQIEPQNWLRQLGAVTWITLRSSIEQIIQRLGIPPLCYQQHHTHDPCYTQMVQVYHQDTLMVTFGQLHPRLLTEFGIEQALFFADIHWESLVNLPKPARLYEPISKFPMVTRDLSLLVDKKVTFQEIQTIISSYKVITHSVHLFDLYEGKNLPENKRAYAIRIVLQDKAKTLADQAIEQIMRKLIADFEQKLHAIIRR